MTQSVQHKELLALLEEATLADPGTIQGPEVLLDMDGWDSMGMVMFIGLIEDKFQLELSVADLRDCETANQLIAQVESRLGEKG